MSDFKERMASELGIEPSRMTEAEVINLLPILGIFRNIDNRIWYKYCKSAIHYPHEYNFYAECHDYHMSYTSHCSQNASVLGYDDTIEYLKNPEWCVIYKPRSPIDGIFDHDPIKCISASICGVKTVIILERHFYLEDTVAFYCALVHRGDLTLLAQTISPWTDMDPLEIMKLFWNKCQKSIRWSVIRDLGMELHKHPDIKKYAAGIYSMSSLEV